MQIENYTFDEFKELARQFHGFAAPGLLISAYMVAAAKKKLPEGTLFEAICESKKCLPDAVQLLSRCSLGNSWVKVLDFGKYALSLYDKYTGQGVRVSLDMEKIKKYPELFSWLMRTKKKSEQDEKKLFAEIELAGDTICKFENVKIHQGIRKRSQSGEIVICPRCGEAYPKSYGEVCKSCQGERYFTVTEDNSPA